MRDFIVVNRAEQIKAVADEKRIRILDLLVARSATVAELAAELREPHAKIYYHVKELERNGIIEMVQETPRAGSAEKHYRAVAHTYLLGRGLGANPDVASAAVGAAEAENLRWRRTNVLGVDYRQVAAGVIRNTLAISPGERVLIEGGPHQIEFLEALVFEVWQAGGDALMEILGEDLLLRAITELPVSVIEQEPPLRADLFGRIDCRIAVDPLCNESLFFHVPEENISAWRVREGKVRRMLNGRTGRTLWIGFPTTALAAMAEADYAELHDAFWQSMSVSPKELLQNAARVLPPLDLPEMTVTGGGGERLRFRTAGPAEIHAGHISRESGRWITRQLPAGTIRLPAAADSASGTFCPGDLVYAGHPIRGISLEFSKGALSFASADSEGDFLRELLHSKTDGRFLAVLVGINPKVQRVVGYEGLDSIAEGAVSIVLAGAGGGSELILTSGEATLAPA